MAVYELNAKHGSVVEAFIGNSTMTLHAAFSRIEHAVSQLDDADVWWRPHPAMNAVGNLLLHLGGNLGQWLLAGVGGHPDTRRRQEEFDHREPIPKAELLARLRRTIDAAAAVVAQQTEASLLTPRHIQHYDTNIFTAIYHAVGHLEGHAQEIIYIARLRLGDRYRFQWMPPAPQP